MKKTFVATTLALAATATFAQAGAPIKIGVVTPLSGTYAGIGQQVKWGLDLAAAQINAGGGVMGRKLELIYEDEEANPAVATQKAEKLFQVNKVDFLTGTVNSGSTLAVGQVAERNNRLIATTVSFADSITADKCSPNVFRVNARAGMQSAALADWLATDEAERQRVLPRPRLRDGPQHRGRLQERPPKARARRPWARCSRRWTTRTTRPSSARSASARPAVIYTSVAGNDTVRLFTQMAEFGLNRNVQVVGASGTVTSQNLPAIGKAADGFVTGVGYSTEHRHAREQEVRRRLRGRQQGRSPTCTAPTATACCSSTRPPSRRPRASTPTSCARRCAACSGPRRRA